MRRLSNYGWQLVKRGVLVAALGSLFSCVYISTEDFTYDPVPYELLQELTAKPLLKHEVDNILGLPVFEYEDDNASLYRTSQEVGMVATTQSSGSALSHVFLLVKFDDEDRLIFIDKAEESGDPLTLFTGDNNCFSTGECIADWQGNTVFDTPEADSLAKLFHTNLASHCYLYLYQTGVGDPHNVPTINDIDISFLNDDGFIYLPMASGNTINLYIPTHKGSSSLNFQCQEKQTYFVVFEHNFFTDNELKLVLEDEGREEVLERQKVKQSKHQLVAKRK